MQLIINQAGTRIRKLKGKFEIKNEKKRHAISPEKIDSMLVSEGISISTDAILLAVSHEIDLLILDKSGQPQVRLWSPAFGSISKIRRQQAFFARSQAGANWIADILQTRIQGMQAHVKDLSKGFPLESEALGVQDILGRMAAKISQWKLSEEILTPEQSARLRGWEGAAAKAYFEYLAAILPPYLQFPSRSRRPAKDPFNCLLNYAYGILYGRIEISLIRAGVDPYLGVFHQDMYNRPVLVYDCIEAFRHWAEEVAMHLCLTQALPDELFELEDGGYFLAESGRKLLIEAFNEFLAQSPAGELIQYSRLHLMDRAAQQLAQKLLRMGDSIF